MSEENLNNTTTPRSVDQQQACSAWQAAPDSEGWWYYGCRSYGVSEIYLVKWGDVLGWWAMNGMCFIRADNLRTSRHNLPIAWMKSGRPDQWTIPEPNS